MPKKKDDAPITPIAADPVKLRAYTEDHTVGMSLIDDESEDTRRRTARLALIVAATRGFLDLAEPMLITAEEIHRADIANLRVVMDVDPHANGLVVSFVREVRDQ